jgi:hypothetical protein
MDQEYLINLGKAIGRMETKLDEALDPSRSCELVQRHERIFNGVTGALRWTGIVLGSTGALIGFAVTVANLIKSL